ncbi:MAG: HD domain-containing protein [Gemmatimonadota bacterium]|nr:HD domain-containing protein [Gemmatimonadota bacterium]
MELHERVTAAAGGVLPDWACVTRGRRAHIERVAVLLDRWGEDLELSETDRARWRAAAYLHDALRDADPEALRDRVPAECRAWPGPMLHGPAAAERLREEGVRDGPLLLSISYHTLGHPELDDLGRALYSADFLEPGRPFLEEWRSALRARMPRALGPVTKEIAAARIGHVVDRRQTLRNPTVAFWNVLVRESVGAGS